MIFSHLKWNQKANNSILIKYQKMSLIESIKVKNLDEYKGIVTGLIDEIGIVKVINEKLGVDNREKITAWVDFD